jgi:hypothetical protein
VELYCSLFPIPCFTYPPYFYFQNREEPCRLFHPHFVVKICILLKTKGLIAIRSRMCEWCFSTETQLLRIAWRETTSGNREKNSDFTVFCRRITSRRPHCGAKNHDEHRTDKMIISGMIRHTTAAEYFSQR